MKRRILIDANPVVPYLAEGKVNGIGRTCIELIEALDKMSDQILFEIQLYTQNVRGVSAKGLKTGFKTWHAYLRNNDMGKTLSRSLRVREVLSRYDLMHITHNYEYVAHPDRCIVTIHDAMFFSYPEAFLGSDNNRKIIPDFARRARHIITISECSKRDIMQYMDIPEEKITVIPWGVDHDVLYPHKMESNRWCGTAPYFTSVSCDRGRKNTITLVRAYEKFVRQNPYHHLVLVWRKPTDEVLEICKNPLLKGRVHFASNISNDELSDIYAGATASFFPSLYEGFGLPIVESMACGTPCVTAENSSLMEVGGDAAIYCDAMDIDRMADIMADFENGAFDMMSLRDKSLNQASKFTWNRCATETVNVYKKCLEQI